MPTTNSLNAVAYIDDVQIRGDAYPGQGYIISRQAGPAVAPTYNAWTKSTGGNIYDAGVWNSIPVDSTAYASIATAVVSVRGTLSS